MASVNDRKEPSGFSLKAKIFAGAFLTLLLALGFNAMLTLSKLEKLYAESIVSRFLVVGQDLRRSLERSLRLGKSLEKFVGMEPLLDKVRLDLLSEISGEPGLGKGLDRGSVEVAVAGPGGGVLYSTDRENVERSLPDFSGSRRDGEGLRYVKRGENYYISLPIEGRDHKQAGTAHLVMTFDKEQVERLVRRALEGSVRLMALVAVCGAAVVILLLNLVTGGSREPVVRARRAFWTILAVVTLAQMVFSAANAHLFHKYYLRITREKAWTLTRLLKEDVEYLLSKGIELDRLVKMDVMMGNILEGTPELSDMSIGRLYYAATREGVVDFQKATKEDLRQGGGFMKVFDPRYNLRLDLEGKDKTAGFISANISRDHVNGQMKEVLLDSATVLVISMLFLVELLILMKPLFLARSRLEGERRVSFTAIRPAAFLLLFGCDLAITFLPLHMDRLYEPVAGISRDMAMGLPISAQMLCAAVALFMAGSWVDRRGWHEPFMIGLTLTVLGALDSWWATGPVHFIVSRGIVGVGYGLTLMASQGFVIAYTDEGSRAQGLTRLFAGAYAGSICGGAAGAMVAERMGYRPVFLVGAAIVFLVIVYGLLVLRRAMREGPRRGPLSAPSRTAAKPAGWGLVFRFLLDRNIAALFLLGTLPAAVALVGFMNYFSPVYLNGMGTSQSNIGRIFMIYGICLVYVAPFVSRYIDASKNKKGYIVLSGALMALAFLAFRPLGGLAATALAFLLFGLSESVDASRAYALKLRVTRELGAAKAMGIYSSVGRLGQVLGPIVFAAFVLDTDIREAVVNLGFVYLAIALGFLLLAGSDKKVTAARDSGR